MLCGPTLADYWRGPQHQSVPPLIGPTGGSLCLPHEPRAYTSLADHRRKINPRRNARVKNKNTLRLFSWRGEKNCAPASENTFWQGKLQIRAINGVTKCKNQLTC